MLDEVMGRDIFLKLFITVMKLVGEEMENTQRNFKKSLSQSCLQDSLSVLSCLQSHYEAPGDIWVKN